MTAATDAALLATDHREALREFVETASQLSPDAWNSAPAPEKWSPGQVTEHLVLTYQIARGELAGREGFRIRTSWWRQRFFQWLILPRILDGRFPRGVPAVREIRPGPGPYDRAAQLRAMTDDGAHFIREMSSVLGQARKFTHPFLGKLDPPTAFRLLTQHLRHHRKQLLTTRDP